MTYVFGFILGDFLGRVGFFRAAGAALLLVGLGFLARQLTIDAGAPQLAFAAAIAAPASLFGWSAWTPAAGGLRLWIVQGVYLVARLSMCVLVGFMAIELLVVQFHLAIWINRCTAALVVAGVMWGVQQLILLLAARSGRVMRERGVLP